jgi:hypothetical protein
MNSSLNGFNVAAMVGGNANKGNDNGRVEG